MAISDQINELRSDISNAYDEIVTKGGTAPEYKNTNNLATSISTIPTGSGPVPTGTIDITENGIYDVAQYANADVNVSGGGGGINNTKIVLAVAQSETPSNIFVGANDNYVAPAGTPMEIPGAVAKYRDSGGVTVEQNIACAVVWLGENEFLTIGTYYTSTGHAKNLQAKLYSVYDDYNNNEYSVSLEDSYSFRWYPEHFDTVSATNASPAIYSLDANHFAISYPAVVEDNGTTYNGLFETFELDRVNKTITVIDMLDLGVTKHVVPTMAGGQLCLIFHKDDGLYKRNFGINTGYIFWQDPEYDLQVLDLSSYSDIQAADSYDIDIFSASANFETNDIVVTAKVTTSPATSNYICTTITNTDGVFKWSGRTTVSSFMDHTPYQFACSNPWNEPNILVLGQKDSSTFLTVQHAPYDYSNASFVDVQMRNASNGYTYRGGWYGNSYPYGGDDVTMQYGAYYMNNQVDYYDAGSASFYQYDMFPSTFDGKSYIAGNNFAYNFYSAKNDYIKSASIVVTRAHVDAQTEVVGEESSRCFMTVFGTMSIKTLSAVSPESTSIFGVTRSSGEFGDLIDVEVQA